MPRIPFRCRALQMLLAALIAFLLPAFWDFGAAPIPASGAMAQSAPTTVSGALGTNDIGRAIDSFIRLGDFYATLAENDPNRHAAGFWLNTADTYRRAGAMLADLDKRGAIHIEALPDGAASRLDAGVIVVDRRLGGQWPDRLVDTTRRGGGDDWGYISQLSTVLLGNLFRLQPTTGQSWFEGHRLRSSLASAATAETPVLKRHLSGFWHLKDKYLWVAMAPDDAGSNPRRLRDAREVHLFSEMTALAKRIERDLGPEWPNRLSGDWREFDRMVDQFSANRGWLALGPGQSAAEAAGEGAATQPAPAASAVGRQTVKAAEPVAAAREQAAAAEPQETAVATPTPDAALEERISRLTKELEASRRESARLKDSRGVLAAALDKASQSRKQLTAELESARRQVTTLQEEIDTQPKTAKEGTSERETRLGEELAASRAETTAVETRLNAELELSRQEAAATEARLSGELESGRATIASLRQAFESERSASQEQATSLEARLTEELEASRRDTAENKARLNDELEAGRAIIASLQQELEAERSENQDKIANLEARLTDELEAGRQEAAATEARLRSELEASRTTIASLQQELEIARAAEQEKTSDLVARLTADLEARRAAAAEVDASRATIASLQQELEAERTANQQKIADLEARLTADLEASRREAAETEAGLASELETSRTAAASLQQELVAERAAGQEKASSLEARLTAELEATQKLGAQREQRLTEELAASRQSLENLETELASTQVEASQETTQRVTKLGASLEASEQTVAALRDQIAAERTAAEQKLTDLEAGFSADLKATEQTAGALRQQLEAERAAAEQKLAGLESQLSTEPQEAVRVATVQAEQLTTELESSRQEAAGLREQLVSLKRPAAGPTPDLWIATTSLMLLVILALITWIMVLWRQRSTVVMPDFAAAGAGGVQALPEVVSAGPNGRSTGPVHAEPLPMKPSDAAAEEASPQLLVEALRLGDTALFESRFANMTGLKGERLRTVIYGGVGEELVVACRALGIDKLVFASIYLLSRKYHSGGQEVGPQDLSRAMAAYDATSEGAATNLLKTWQQTAGPQESEKGGENGTAEKSGPNLPSNTRH